MKKYPYLLAALVAVVAPLVLMGAYSTGGGISGCPTNFTAVLGNCVWTLTASSSATLDFTGLGATYNNYSVLCNGMVPATSGDRVLIRVGEGGTPTWETGNSYTTAAFDTNSSASAMTFYNGTSVAIVPGASNTTTTSGFSESIGFTITDVPSSTLYKKITGWYAMIGSNYYNGSFSGDWGADTNAITGVRIYYNNGNISSGKCTMTVLPQ